jgi:hypothetical protein
VLAREGIALGDAATMLGLSPAEIEQDRRAAVGDAAGQSAVTSSPLQPAKPLSGWPGARDSFRVLTVLHPAPHRSARKDMGSVE